jgi:hypothetical protein
MMTYILSFPRSIAKLSINPVGAWESLGRPLQLSGALFWQLAGGIVCLLLLILRVNDMVSSNHLFSGAGLNIIIALTMTVQLLCYFLYILVGAGIIRTISALDSAQTSYRQTLALFGHTTFPLLIAWICRVIVAWLRDPGGLPLHEDPHTFVAAVWSSTSIQADLGALYPGAAPFAAVILATVGLFWIWHWVTLWGALRNSVKLPLKTACLIVATMVVLVMASNIVEVGFAGNWRELLVWNN